MCREGLSGFCRRAEKEGKIKREDAGGGRYSGVEPGHCNLPQFLRLVWPRGGERGLSGLRREHLKKDANLERKRVVCKEGLDRQERA